TPLSPNNALRRTVFPACDTSKLRRATWLTFRRTYSAWSHEKGIPGKVIAQLMGHAAVDTTLNIYTQVLDGPPKMPATWTQSWTQDQARPNELHGSDKPGMYSRKAPLDHKLRLTTAYCHRRCC